MENRKKIGVNRKKALKIFCCSLSAIFFFQCRSFSDVLSENQARVGPNKGIVQILAQGAKDWVDVHDGLPLEPGDHIETGDDGEVDIILSDNAVWHILPNTDLFTEHMELNAGRFTITQGVLLGKIDALRAGAAQRWEFNTPAAECDIRGTEFIIEVSTSNPVGTRLAVYEGQVEMTPAETAAGEQPATRVEAMQEWEALRGKSLKRLAHFSQTMQTQKGKMKELRDTMRTIQGTWSPFTPEVRTTMRKKFIAPPEKPVHRKPKVRRRRGAASEAEPGT